MGGDWIERAPLEGERDDRDREIEREKESFDL